VFRAADAALCKSGTTTLESAFAGCPLVVAYRTSALTYAAARRLVRIPHIGLVNVVAGRALAPEFVQDALQPGPVAAALAPLLDAGSETRRRRVEVRHGDQLAAARAQGRPVIFSLWHGHQLPLLYHHRDQGIVLLVSQHRDGEIITRIAEHLGYRAVRGSTSRGAARALAGMIHELEARHDVAITP